MAAAYTTVTSYVLSFTLHYFAGRKIDRELYPIKIYILPVSLVLIFTQVAVLAIEFWMLRWGMALVILIIALLRFKNIDYFKK